MKTARIKTQKVCCNKLNFRFAFKKGSFKSVAVFQFLNYMMLL